MSALKIGAAVAAVTAGPKLYALVQSGDLTAGVAFTRWAGVVAACALGVVGIRRIMADYAQQAEAAARAAERGAPGGEPVVLEGTPIRSSPSPGV
jgi:hypothetical protein